MTAAPASPALHRADPAARSWIPGSGSGLQDAVRIGLFILLAALIAGPLVILVMTSFAPAGTLSLVQWSFTLDNYRDVVSRPNTWQVLLNTLVFAGGSVTIGVAISVLMALLTERTDLPFRTTIRIMMFSWMAVPPLVFGFGWILLINPGSGVLNLVLMWLFGLETAPLTPYSMWSLIIISGLSLVPTCYVMISGLLRNMDPTLEDAALVSGASPRKVLQRITTPLLTPGILSVFVFLIMAMVQTFDLPMIIGLTARVPVLSTRIYLAASPDSGVPNYGLAGAFGVFLLGLAMVLMVVYFRSIRSGEKYRVVTGKGFRPKRSRLRGPARAVAMLAVGAYFATMLAPMLILGWASLFPFYRPPALAELPNMSLAAYRAILANPQTLSVIANTVTLFLSASVLVMLVACLVSWFAVRGAGRWGKALDMMSFAPMAIPPVVMAVALLVVFLGTPLNGTIWVLVIGHLTIYLAFGTRTMNGAFIQIHKDLENAAVVSGATWASGLRYILFPMVWPHILNAWLWVVAHSARDLTFPLILLTSTNVVAASAIFLRWDYPDLPGAAALSMLLVLALMALVVPVQIYLARKSGEA